MNAAIRSLEDAALEAHQQNTPWGEFWSTVADRVRECEPFNREAYRRLIGRLLHLLCCGDESGERPPDDDPSPWEDDDAVSPHDAKTKAKLQPGVLPAQAQAIRDRIIHQSGVVWLTRQAGAQ